ncbi:MAG TPA: ImmA/IrrE family metallo-endopeptidase [Solirubrobacteraceae bacterium]|nr:ImmA/IrrE family metallo-endopeptidase [Solirubrobacteraceae bacterium]
MTSEIKKEACSDANKLLDEVWRNGIPVDPVVVARLAGLRVLEDASLDSNILGALIKEPHQEPLIMLNANDHPNRRRFTCAHEIGHFVRRGATLEPYTTIDFRDASSTRGEDDEEIYANEFAACLLMPDEDVKRFVEEGLGDLEMSIRFGVSREAMNFRLSNLGLG